MTATTRIVCAFTAFAMAACAVAASACRARQDTAPPATRTLLYVSAEQGGAVVIVNPETGEVVGRIPVGKRPRGLRLSRDGKSLLVALSGSPIAGPGVDESKLPPADRAADGIAMVDLAAGKVTRRFPSGQDPESFDLSPDGRILYVSNEETAEMSELDLTSGTIRRRVQVGEEPEGVTVRPDGEVVYVTAEGDNAVVAVDTKTFAVVGRMTTGARPRSIVFTPDGLTAFVTAENGGAVTVLDAKVHRAVASIPITGPPSAPIPPRPMGAVLSPDGRQLFVSNGRARSIAVIDVASRSLLRLIDDVGARPWGIGVSADGRKLYTANGPSGDVSIVDIATGAVDRRVPVGGSPWGLVVARGN